MTEPLQVGQFAIVDHEPVDRGPNAGVFTGKGPSDDRAELYIVAEGTTPAGEAFAGHVISAAGQAWTSLDMSLTGSLHRVFAEADRNVADWNARSIAHHRVQLGVAAFARRGTQAVVAQAGPSAVFHISGDALTVHLPEGDHAAPVGGGMTEPVLRRITFAPGDRLLLISTPALEDMDDELVGGILALRQDQILPEIYRRVEHLRHVTVLLVTAPGVRQAPPPALPEPVIGEDDTTHGDPVHAPGRDFMPRSRRARLDEDPLAFQPSLFIDDDHEDVVQEARRQLVQISARARQAASVPVVRADIPEPLRKAAGDDSLARMAAERLASATLAQETVQAQVAVAAAGARSGWRPAGPTGPLFDAGDARRRHQRHSFTRGLVRDEAPPLPDTSLDEVPLAAELAEEARARTTALAAVSTAIPEDGGSAVSTGGSLVRVRSSMSGRWKGGSGLGGRRATPTAQLPPTWLVIIVGLGVLLTLVGFLTLPGILDQDEGARYSKLVDEAQQKVATAGALQSDPTQRRRALTEAQAMLLEARELDAGGPEANQLLTTLNNAIAAMDAVRAPASVEVLGSLEQFGEKPVVVSRMSVMSEAAYVLDSASNQVIAMSLLKDERKVVFTEDKDAKRGRPVALAPFEATDLGDPSLLVVDSNRALWAYSAQGVRQLGFAAPGNLSVTDIAVYGRDLYVLDASASQVLRFSPADGGFSSPPAKVLETPDLAAARRLFVDQEVVTSDANGQVHRFSGQVSLALSEGGIDKRLAAPELPQPLGENGELAILDAANDRIVVLRRDGAFDHQYRHADFRAMSALAIRDGVGYVFSGGKLRRVTF